MPRRISPTLLELPDKYFFTIGEVSHLTWVKPAMLRYWESRFKPLRPARRESGQRKYTRRDISIIKRIRKLLVEEKLTIDGARKQLASEMKRGEDSENNLPAKTAPLALLKEIRKEIEEMSRELSSND